MEDGVADTHCVLWDFGGTLCDERFIWNSGPEWMEVYQTFEDGLGAAWSLGEIDTQAFATELSKRMAMSADAIITHMTERCRHIEFFPQTYEFFKAHDLPQAIVTVNPDLFTDVIEPICGFDSTCDVIVTSWQERTIDKAILCEIAVQRLGLSCANRQALLIDNKQENIDAWASRDGAVYLFTTDDQFGRDLADGIDALTRASRH